mgnify:CR=1 FL=1
MTPDLNLHLSEHFQLKEFVRSKLAEVHRIDNTPPAEAVVNMRGLCVNTLEPIRFFIGRPIVVSSGFRCPKLNVKAGGSPTSDHMFGRAVDIEVPGMDNLALAHLIADGGFVFDQLILEFYKVGTPASGWCHVSWRKDPRFQVRTARKNPNTGKIDEVPGLPPIP